MALEILDLESIGAIFGLRNCGLEINIQQLEIVDLEQNGNWPREVIHRVWKSVA